VNGKPQTILGSSPSADQAEVLIAEDVMFDQPGVINWDRFKSLTLRGRKKLTQRHPRWLPLAGDGVVAFPRKQPGDRRGMNIEKSSGIRCGLLSLRDHLHNLCLLLR
jgi:hypothetical protein